MNRKQFLSLWFIGVTAVYLMPPGVQNPGPGCITLITSIALMVWSLGEQS